MKAPKTVGQSGKHYIVALRRQGFSEPQIAEWLGISRTLRTGSDTRSVNHLKRTQRCKV